MPINEQPRLIEYAPLRYQKIRFLGVTEVKGDWPGSSVGRALL